MIIRKMKQFRLHAITLALIIIFLMLVRQYDTNSIMDSCIIFLIVSLVIGMAISVIKKASSLKNLKSTFICIGLYFILLGLHIVCGEAIPGEGLPYLMCIAIGQYICSGMKNHFKLDSILESRYPKIANEYHNIFNRRKSQEYLSDSLDEIMKSEPSNEIKETIMRIYDEYITFSLYFYLFILTVMKIVLSAAS